MAPLFLMTDPLNFLFKPDFKRVTCPSASFKMTQLFNEQPRVIYDPI